MLGIIVEITVKLLPKPERAQVMLAAFDDVTRAGEAVGAIIAAGIIPAGLELMDQLAIRAAEDFAHAGYPRDAAAILLCELDGTNAEVSEHIMAPNGNCSGKDASPPSPPWAASRRTTTAWTAPSRAANCRACYYRSASGRKNTACR